MENKLKGCESVVGRQTSLKRFEVKLEVSAHNGRIPDSPRPASSYKPSDSVESKGRLNQLLRLFPAYTRLSSFSIRPKSRSGQPNLHDHTVLTIQQTLSPQDRFRSILEDEFKERFFGGIIRVVTSSDGRFFPSLGGVNVVGVLTGDFVAEKSRVGKDN